MLSNILTPAVMAIKSLCPEVMVTITSYIQQQEWFSDDTIQDTPLLQTKALAQTMTPAPNTVLVNTVNSIRQFKLYFTSHLDILSSLQQPPTQLMPNFTYNNVPVQAQVVAFNDHRYNGWSGGR